MTEATLARDIESVIALSANATEAELRPSIVAAYHALQETRDHVLAYRLADTLAARDLAAGGLAAVVMGALCESYLPAEPVVARLLVGVRRALRDPEHLSPWCRAAVATLTRSPRALGELQRDAAFWDALSAVADTDEFAWFLQRLRNVLFDAPLILIEPASQRAMQVTISGFTDLAQAHVVLLDVLLPRVGPAVERPSPALVANALGEGPQQIDEAFTSPWRFYLHRALEPDARSIRRDGIAWSSPGGTGSGPLPHDFEPAAIDMVDGVRTLLIDTAPKFRHVLGGSRTFQALRASVRFDRDLPDAPAFVRHVAVLAESDRRGVALSPSRTSS